MNFLLTGGTGFIGTHLTQFLQKGGHTCYLLTRNPEKYEKRSSATLKFHHYEDLDIIADLVEKSEVVINMAGENLFDQRWTKEVKKRIVSSRLDTTQNLVELINKAKNKPEVFISASAVGIYGDRDDEELTEESLLADDFLAKVCRQWEEAAMGVDDSVRLINPRIGIAIEKDGGALKKMLTPFKMFAGGPLGDGKQYFPWIHMQDICESMLFAILKKDFRGAYNATAPNPVSMNTFSKALGKTLNRPSYLSVPEIALKLALGEAAEAIAASLRVYPQKLLDAGYEFRYPDVNAALENVLKR